MHLSVTSAAEAPAIEPAAPAELRTRLDAEKGKVVLLNFWATWCRPCLKELPELLALEQELAPRGFKLMTVSLDDPADATTTVPVFIAKWFPTLSTLARTTTDMDATVTVVDNAWNEVLPTSYVIDREGKVVKRLQGGKTKEQFAAEVLPLLGGP